MQREPRTILHALGPALALLALAACDTSVPTDSSALPRSKAPRDWAVSHAKETGAPSSETPKQHAANQGGDSRAIRAEAPAPPDPTSR